MATHCSILALEILWTEESGWLQSAAAATAKSLQLCPTLCDLIDSSPPGSLIPGILQARTLEWVEISFSNAWKWKVKVKSLSPVWLLATVRLLHLWDFPGKSTGVGCHCLLQIQSMGCLKRVGHALATEQQESTVPQCSHKGGQNKGSGMSRFSFIKTVPLVLREIGRKIII